LIIRSNNDEAEAFADEFLDVDSQRSVDHLFQPITYMFSSFSFGMLFKTLSIKEKLKLIQKINCVLVAELLRWPLLQPSRYGRK
jgi:hypothetical protein